MHGPGRGAVEMGCFGGHGRTGTALACHAVLDDVSAPTAAAWAGERATAHADETPDQKAFAEMFATP